MRKGKKSKILKVLTIISRKELENVRQGKEAKILRDSKKRLQKEKRNQTIMWTQVKDW